MIISVPTLKPEAPTAQTPRAEDKTPTTRAASRASSTMTSPRKVTTELTHFDVKADGRKVPVKRLKKVADDEPRASSSSAT